MTSPKSATQLTNYGWNIELPYSAAFADSLRYANLHPE